MVQTSPISKIAKAKKGWVLGSNSEWLPHRLEEIPDLSTSKRKKKQRISQVSMVACPCCLWTCGEAAHHGKNMWQRKLLTSW
jgi:hypothetical protein